MAQMTIILLLLLAAMVLGFLEICTPSFGLLAVGAVAALFSAVYMAFQYDTWVGAVVTIAAAAMGPAYIVLLVRILPRTPLGKRLFLKRAVDASGAAAPDSDVHESLVGKTGTAETLLRPGGAVRIDGKRVMAQSESGIIKRGTPVKVIGADSMNVIVRAVK